MTAAPEGLTTTATAAVAASAPATPAQNNLSAGAPTASGTPNNPTTAHLLDCGTVDGVRIILDIPTGEWAAIVGAWT